jgi:hypothetical protein
MNELPVRPPFDGSRDSGREHDSRYSNREPSRGKNGDWATQRGKARKLERLREAEHSLDLFHRLSQERSDQTHLAFPREERQRSALSSPGQGIYTDRDRSYSLRDSEVLALSEVGKFRVVDIADLAQFAYSRDRSRMERDVSQLGRQGLLEQRGTNVLKRLHARYSRSPNEGVASSGCTLSHRKIRPFTLASSSLEKQIMTPTCTASTTRLPTRSSVMAVESKTPSLA